MLKRDLSYLKNNIRLEKGKDIEIEN